MSSLFVDKLFTRNLTCRHFAHLHLEKDKSSNRNVGKISFLCYKQREREPFSSLNYHSHCTFRALLSLSSSLVTDWPPYTHCVVYTSSCRKEGSVFCPGCSISSPTTHSCNYTTIYYKTCARGNNTEGYIVMDTMLC